MLKGPLDIWRAMNNSVTKSLDLPVAVLNMKTTFALQRSHCGNKKKEKKVERSVYSLHLPNKMISTSLQRLF